MNKVTGFFAIAILLTTSLGCGWVRRAQIESDLDELRPKKASAQARLDEVYRRYQSIEGEANKLNAALTANHNAAIALLRDNPGTVACIASGAVALSEGNVFSDDAKELGAAVGLFCLGVYIFSEDFQKSADNLVSRINAASAQENTLRSKLEALKPQLEAETRIWQREKLVVDGLSREISKLETELREYN